VLQTYLEKLKTRMQELVGSHMDPERILQEAALLVDRSDVQEELVRLETHVKQFLGLSSRAAKWVRNSIFVAGDESRS
jgi:uncharacterized protein (TIGR00255 family)